MLWKFLIFLQVQIKEKAEEDRRKTLEKRQQFKEQNKQKLVFDPVEMERKERARKKVIKIKKFLFWIGSNYLITMHTL